MNIVQADGGNLFIRTITSILGGITIALKEDVSRNYHEERGSSHKGNVNDLTFAKFPKTASLPHQAINQHFLNCSFHNNSRSHNCLEVPYEEDWSSEKFPKLTSLTLPL